MTYIIKSTGLTLPDGHHAMRVTGEKIERVSGGTYDEIAVRAVVIDPPPPADVANAMALTAALNAAKGGEVIRLAGGNYGDFSLSANAYTAAVRVVSADPANPARFRSITLTRCTNMTLDGLVVDYTPNAATNDNSAGISIPNCTDVTVTDCKVSGGPSVVDGLLIGRGIYSIYGKNITIANNDISQFRRGIQTPKINGLKVLHNYIHDLRTTPIGGGVASNVLIEGNHLEGSRPNNFGGAGDHGDFIHYWTQPSQIGPNDNIVIRGNFIEQGDGVGILGIYLDNNDNPQGFKDVLIENNIIHNSNGQGMRLEDVVGGTVRNNTLLQTEGDYTDAPRIRIEDGCRNITISANIVANTTTGDAAAVAARGRPAAVVAAETQALRAANNIVETGTVVVQYADPAAPNYQGDIFVGMPKKNGTLADMQKLPGALPTTGATLTPAMVYPARSI